MLRCLTYSKHTLQRYLIGVTVVAVLLGNVSSVLAAPPAQDTTSWLVMYYGDADDEILEYDILTDANKIELAGSAGDVQLVAQLDRFKGGYHGDGDWTSTKRFFITYDEDLKVLASEELEDIGEVAMSDGDTLADFITWAATEYPADKYVLILSDHGAGWPGGWSDPDPGGLGAHDIALAHAFGDMLFLMEIDDALSRAQEAAGIAEFELIGMDACLMSDLAVYTALAAHARYAVASQESEPDVGWAYNSFLKTILEDPTIDGATLAQQVVDSYLVDDAKITDPRERAERILGMMEESDEVSAEELIELRDGLEKMTLDEIAAQIPGPEAILEDLEDKMTLTAVDLAQIPDVLSAVSGLAQALTGVDQKHAAAARTYAQAFETVFDDNEPSPYLDLGNVAELLKQTTGDAQVAAAADEVIAALGRAVIGEKHGRQKVGATGISIYFPNSTLFAADESGYDSFVTVADRFAASTLWDDFLLYHYTGATVPEEIPQFAAERLAPRPAGEVAVGAITAPGASPVHIAPLQLSAQETSVDKPLTINTTISGDSVGYIYLYVGFYDEESNAMLLADLDYVDNEDNKEIGGVIYPDWGDEQEFPLEFEWEPQLYVIEDGEHAEFALLEPDTYGATAEDSVYTVSGIFEPASGGQRRYATLYFNGDGALTGVSAYTNLTGIGPSRRILPKEDDTFTILEQWMDLSEEDVQFYNMEGGTLTFGTQPFAWEAVPAPPGEYEIGFIAEDLDGNSYEEYAPVVVVD